MLNQDPESRALGAAIAGVLALLAFTYNEISKAMAPPINTKPLEDFGLVANGHEQKVGPILASGHCHGLANRFSHDMGDGRTLRVCSDVTNAYTNAAWVNDEAFRYSMEYQPDADRALALGQRYELQNIQLGDATGGSCVVGSKSSRQESTEYMFNATMRGQNIRGRICAFTITMTHAFG